MTWHDADKIVFQSLIGNDPKSLGNNDNTHFNSSQCSKKTNKRTNKQTDKQTNRQRDTHTNR